MESGLRGGGSPRARAVDSGCEAAPVSRPSRACGWRRRRMHASVYQCSRDTSACLDRVDFFGIEGEMAADGGHLVVRLLVAPHRVLGAALEREVRRVALERAVRGVR